MAHPPFVLFQHENLGFMGSHLALPSVCLPGNIAMLPDVSYQILAVQSQLLEISQHLDWLVTAVKNGNGMREPSANGRTNI